VIDTDGVGNFSLAGFKLTQLAFKAIMKMKNSDCAEGNADLGTVQDTDARITTHVTERSYAHSAQNCVSQLAQN
jgi:hypothetical protein